VHAGDEFAISGQIQPSEQPRQLDRRFAQQVFGPDPATFEPAATLADLVRRRAKPRLAAMSALTGNWHVATVSTAMW
jgi:hypothetical protein